MSRKEYQHWTQEQDNLLVNSVLKFGRNWTMLQEEVLSDFSVKQMKNRLHYLITHVVTAEIAERLNRTVSRLTQKQKFGFAIT